MGSIRPRVRGKFLFAGEEKLYVRGVTYGPFRPGDDGAQYHSPEIIERPFVAIPLAAGVLANWGILLSPAVGAVLMSVSTIVVAINAQLLRRTAL